MHIANTESRDKESNVISTLLSMQGVIKTDLDRATQHIASLHGDVRSLKQQIEDVTPAIGKVQHEARKLRASVKPSARQIELEGYVKKANDDSLTWLVTNVVAAIVTGGASIPLGGPIQIIAEQNKSALRKELEEEIARAGSANKWMYDEECKALALLRNERKTLQSVVGEIQGRIPDEEKRKLYFGVLQETQLQIGLNAARSLDQHAMFAGTAIDDVFLSVREDAELYNALHALVQGTPGAGEIALLMAEGERLKLVPSPTPEQRALKQWVNHVLVPHNMYFEVVASIADDIRAQGDLSTYPPLEIFGHKPISLSGRRQLDDADAPTPEQLVQRAKAIEQITNKVKGADVKTLLNESGVPHMEKMQKLIDANETEIASYADVFDRIEVAINVLEHKRADLAGQHRTHADRLIGAEKANADIDARIREMDARNQAKQKAATRGSIARGSLAVAAGVALAICDGGIFSGALVAEGAKSLAAEGGKSVVADGSRSLAGMLAIKTLKDSHHSITYGIGQGVATWVENTALADYMDSLRAQKVNIPALKGEIEAVEKAIVETVGSKQFQDLMQSEAKRSYVAETLLQRSLIRNGYNNASDIDELARDHGLASVDAVLQHYQGTRLGLALQKHCHGIADSNDMRVLLTESDCLRGQPDGADAVLREYVEGTMKPNIGAFLSKASKMDVVRQANLTGYGTDLHFPAEIGMENSRAVRILLANEFGMSVVGRNDVRDMFDFWLHRYGDRQLYDDKIRDGEMTDHYPDKRVSHVSAEAMGRFVDMAKRSVESGRASFPKIGDPFLRMCAYSYFKPQAVNVGGKDNIFTDHPESSCAYPCVNDVVREFIRRLSFSDIGAYREKIGERLDNVIATSFIDFFEEVGKLHHDNEQLTAIRGRVRDAANYDDYRPVFDRYARSITRDAMSRFDMFLDIYRTNLETQMRVCGIEDREVLAAQVEGVKHLADGKLSPPIVQPGSHAARLQAHDECFTGENLGVFARG